MWSYRIDRWLILHDVHGSDVGTSQHAQRADCRSPDGLRAVPRHAMVLFVFERTRWHEPQLPQQSTVPLINKPIELHRIFFIDAILRWNRGVRRVCAPQLPSDVLSDQIHYSEHVMHTNHWCASSPLPAAPLNTQSSSRQSKQNISRTYTHIYTQTHIYIFILNPPGRLSADIWSRMA